MADRSPAPTPILPRSQADPIAQDARIARAQASMRRRLRSIGSQVRDLYMEALRATSRRVAVINAQYQYTLTPAQLADLEQQVDAIIEATLLEGGREALWLTVDYVEPAYQQGTSQEMANLARQSTTYRASRPDLRTLIDSEPYRRRLGHLLSRVHADVSDIGSTLSRDIALTLADGMAQGRAPSVIAETLRDQSGMRMAQAERVARTEIGDALRQSRMDEADQARRDLGVRTMEMHVSALSPTTRRTHAERHGRLYTTQEQREWWSRDGNRINCKCSTVSVLVDDQGRPLNPGIIQRARQVRDRRISRIYGTGRQ